MKSTVRAFASLVFVLASATAAAAQGTTQDVTLVVDAIDEVQFDQGAQTLTISDNTLTTSSTGLTWSVTTNSATAKRVQGAITAGTLPTNSSLTLNLTAPTTGTSAGAVSLTSTPTDLVTSIDAVSEAGLGMTYNFTAQVDTPPNGAGATVTVTLTIIT